MEHETLNENLAIKEKATITNERIENYLETTEALDEINYKDKLKYIPNFIDETKLIVSAFERTIAHSSELSKECMAHYKETSEIILKFIENESLSEKNTKLLIKLLKNNNKQIKSLHKKDKKFMNKQFNKLTKYGTTAVAIMGVLLGATYVKNKKVKKR